MMTIFFESPVTAEVSASSVVTVVVVPPEPPVVLDKVISCDQVDLRLNLITYPPLRVA